MRKKNMRKLGSVLLTLMLLLSLLPSAVLADPPSSDAGVSSVTVSAADGAVAATRDAEDAHVYAVAVPYGTEVTTADTIQVTPSDANATVSTPASADEGATWTFTVTAEDGVTTADYTLNITVADEPQAVSLPKESQFNADEYLSDLGFRIALKNAAGIQDYYPLMLEPEDNDHYTLYYPRTYSAQRALQVTAAFTDPDNAMGRSVFANLHLEKADAGGGAPSKDRKVELHSDFSSIYSPGYNEFNEQYTDIFYKLPEQFSITLENAQHQTVKTYTITLKTYQELYKLAVTCDESSFARPTDKPFSPTTCDYAVDVDPTAESVTIAAEGGNNNVTVLLNGETASNKNIQTFSMNSLTWIDNKCVFPVVISNTVDAVDIPSVAYTLTLARQDQDYMPVVESPPATITYAQFSIPTPLVATCTFKGEGVATYQWYSGPAKATQNGLVEGATSSTFVRSSDYATPITGTYYKCRVTYTVNGFTYVVSTTPTCVKVTISQADTPVFDLQPQGASYKIGKTADILSVHATARDAGPLPTIKYQWFSNSAPSTEGSTSVSSNATNGYQFSPPTNAVGTIYYYCIATNTPATSYTASAVSDIVAVTVVDAGEWAGSGTEESPYLIESIDDFAKLRDAVNVEGVAFSGMVFKLTGDIGVPLGFGFIGALKPGFESPELGKHLNPFSGIFDGGGHTMTIAKGGLTPFGYMRMAAIKNLNIYGEEIAGYGLVNQVTIDYGDDGDSDFGLPKVPWTLNIDNVTLKSGTKTRNSGFIGGISSGANKITITNCTAEEGVVIGYTKDQSMIGSFVGSVSGTMSNCVSSATVYGTGGVGGLWGGKGQSMGACLITNSAFLGVVEAAGDYAGGIIARGYDGGGTAPNTPLVSIRNCYVAGNITGANKVGGIFGGEPGCEDAWENGQGFITDNYFYGTVTATSGTYAGGIVGFLKSFNKNQGISNCYYLDTCGTNKGVGYIETIVTKDHPKYGEHGIDYEFVDSDYSIASTAEQFADGTVLAALNASATSLKNWLQGEEYPVFAAKAVLVGLNISGTYKDSYVLGDALDLTGIEYTAVWSDGSEISVDPSNVTISGYDKTTRGVQTLTLTYGAVSAQIQVTVLKPVTNATTIRVYFQLLGDNVHDSDTDGLVHTLSKNNLTQWIPRTPYTVDLNATVLDVFEQALTANGMTWENDGGNYIASVTRNGVTLGEFTNGPLSGWMYTLNGTHPLNGVSEQFLEDNDNIVFHYTDDYTKEKGTDKWGPPPGGTTAGAAPLVSSNKEFSADQLQKLRDTNQSLDLQYDQLGISLNPQVLPALTDGKIKVDTSVVTDTTALNTFFIAHPDLTGVLKGYSVTMTQENGSGTTQQLTQLNGNIDLHFRLKDEEIKGLDPSTLTVFKVADDGQVTQFPATYNYATGNLTITANHLCTFYIMGQEGLPTQRLSGDDRYATAAAISAQGWTTSDNVILAGGENFPDALAATALAGLKDAPVLLTGKDTLNSKTLAEIQRLKAKTIFVIGGTGVISQAIEDQLKKDYIVNRIYGADRYATAVKIGEQLRAEKPSDTAILATGLNYPDALSIAPFAGKLHYPVLFTGNGALNEQTKQALTVWGVKNVYILGGTGAVSTEVENTLKALGVTVTRLAGSDRYQTSLAIAQHFADPAAPYTKASLATGLNFPDALTGAALAAKAGSPVLLVSPDASAGPDSAIGQLRAYLQALAPSKIYIFGGTGVIPEGLKNQITLKAPQNT